MSLRVVYLEGYVRQTIPVLVDVPEDFIDGSETLSLSASIMNTFKEESPFEFWQPFSTKIQLGEETMGKPALKLTRLKEEECRGHVKFKVEKLQ